MEVFLLVKHFSFLPSFSESYGVKGSFIVLIFIFYWESRAWSPGPNLNKP